MNEYFCWTHYYDLAEDMRKRSLDNSQDEAIDRSIISRAYYSAFCSCKEYLIKYHEKSYGLSSNTHEEVCEDLIETQEKKLKETAHFLRMLRKNRNKADYDINLNKSPNQLVRFSMKLAKDILNNIEYEV